MKKPSNKHIKPRGIRLSLKGSKPSVSVSHSTDSLLKTAQYNVEPVSLTGNIVTPTETTKRRGARQSQALAYNTLPKSLDKQSSIFDILNQDQAIRKEIVTNNLDKIGAELSVTQQRALGATLELLHNTGAYRRADEQLEAGQRVTVEEIVVPLQDFLQAYGLDKTVTGRGKLDYRGGRRYSRYTGTKRPYSSRYASMGT